MATRITVTGNIAEPELRHTSQGTPVLELRISGTYAKKDKDTGQWEDQGEPLWHSATFWEEQAVLLSESLGRGSRVTVEGVQVMEAFTRRDGSQGTQMVVVNPRFLGTVPRRQPSGGYQQQQAPVQQAQQQSDPWSTPGGPTTMEAPF